MTDSTSKHYPDDYLPRTNYRPMADRAEYARRTPTSELECSRSHHPTVG